MRMEAAKPLPACGNAAPDAGIGQFLTGIHHRAEAWHSGDCVRAPFATILFHSTFGLVLERTLALSWRHRTLVTGNQRREPHRDQLACSHVIALAFLDQDELLIVPHPDRKYHLPGGLQLCE